MSWRVRLLLLVVLLLAAGVVATRVRLTTDLDAALPADGPVAQAFADVRTFSLLDTLVFDVDGEGATPEALGAAVDALGVALEGTGHFASVRYRYGIDDGARLRKAAAGSVATLTPPEVLARRLSPAGMDEALARARAGLFGPAGALVARTLPGDPLDLGGAFTAGIVAMGADPSTQLHDGHVLSADGTHALVVARAAEPALGTTWESPIITDIQAVVAASPLPVAWLGPHRYAAEAAEQIHGEVQLALSADTALMVLVFLLAFRSLRPLAGTVPALVVAALGAGVMAAARSPLHGIALAFGGALAGMGVDYWIHLYLTGLRDGVEGTFAARLRQADRALRELAPAYAMSVAATLAAFAMLATSSYRAVADLGFIGIGTVIGALGAVVLAGPLGFALLARPGDGVPRLPVPEKVPPLVAAAVGVVFLGLAVVAAGVEFDGDPRAMDARIPATAKLEQAFEGRFGGASTSALLVAEGDSLDAALDDLATAQAALADCTGITVRSPLSLLPPPSARARNAAAVGDVDALEAHFREAAEAQGFDADSLVPGLRASLTALAAPTVATWAGTPGEEILSRTVRVHDDGTAQVAALITGVSEDALDHAAHEIRLASPPARFVMPARVATEGADTVRSELMTRSGLALVAVLVFMALRYRDPVRVLAATAPSLAAAAGTLGLHAWFDIPLTAASGPALVLVLGVAFDQGVFLVEAEGVSRSAFLASRAAILIALATAFAGFAGLTIATHPAVHGIGLVVSIGIACTFVAAFGFVPAVLEPAGAERAATILRRGALVAVVLVQLDALAAVLGWARPPALPAGEGARPGEVAELGPLDRRLGSARLVRRHGLWVLRAEGSAAEIGHAIGVLADQLPADNEHSIEREFAHHVPSPLVRYALARGTPILSRLMAEFIPTPFLEEVEAYARVVPDALPWVAPVYTRKLCYHAIHDIGQAMVDSPFLACTGFAAGGERTPDGHGMLARNFDFDGGRVFDEDKAVVYVHRDGTIPFLHVAIVGLSGAVSGVNAEGIGVAVLAGASDAPIRVGDPMIFILREVLESARTLDDVERILDARRGFVAEGILAVDAAGTAVVFEVTPDDVTRLDAGANPALGSAIALSNHFRGERHAHDAANHLRMIEGTSVARLARMEELVGVDRGPLDLARSIAILRDRRGVGDAPLPARHESAINADIASHGVVIDATERSLTVSTFPALSGPFVRFRLDDVAAGNLDGEVVAGPDEPDRTWRSRLARKLVEDAAHQPAAEAEVGLRKALRANSGDIDATLALGLLLRDAGRLDEARPLLQAVIDTPPERASQLRAATTALDRADGDARGAP